jgi:hypothetical protein
MMARFLGLLLTALVAVPFARGADIVAYHTSGTYGAIGYEATVVWGRGEYLLDLWSKLGTDTKNLAKNRQAAEAALEQKLEAVFLQSVVSLPVSSRETVGSRIKASPALLPGLKRLVGAAIKRRSHLAQENEDLRLRYAFPLRGEDGLMTLLEPPGQPSPFDRYLGFVPAAAYTGLVIYAQGVYPAWGRDGAEAALKPCLFPRIYDTDMNPVMDATQADRGKLETWGMVAYSNELDETPFLDRVGANPARTVARGVYGVGDTDIVISRDVARLLLGREENLKMLGEGRILVILDAEKAPELPAAQTGSADAPLEELTPANPGGAKILAPATGR